MPLPGKDEMFNTKGRMLQNIMVDLGGRIAEELVLDDITTGASQDIRQATQIARAMVTQYGMSDRVGMVSYGENEEEVFIGLELGHGRSYGEEMATMIDEEVKRLVNEAYARCEEILASSREKLEAVAQYLLEHEVMDGADFEALYQRVPAISAEDETQA